ncbi:MAG: DUF1646 family protein [Endomicrobiaceae bacterium]|nr:DUF1646 family protein [Endomicrobiaceae bacterium]
MLDILLSAIIVIVIVMPLVNKHVEENLEIFIFVVGLLAVTVSNVWNWELLKITLEHPIMISLTVLIMGILFKVFNKQIIILINVVVKNIGIKWTLALSTFVLGLVSSVTTAIIAALILSEVATVIHMNRHEKIKFIVYACFAIGIGAVLTPVGEPLGTIILSKLSGSPHNAGFLFMIDLLWIYILSSNIFLGILSYKIVKKDRIFEEHMIRNNADTTNKEIVHRFLKVYAFVAGLILLGDGLKPLAYKTVVYLGGTELYWINMLSAVLDNATMAAIEIVPEMSTVTLKYLIVSLIISGGIMIPGNIPNIICASKLKITSKEWVKVGFPLGMAMLVFYFLFIKFIY